MTNEGPLECAPHYERRVGGNGHDILVLTKQCRCEHE